MRFIKNLNIQTRLLIGALAIILLFGSTSITEYNKLLKIEKKNSVINNLNNIQQLLLKLENNTAYILNLTFKNSTTDNLNTFIQTREEYESIHNENMYIISKLKKIEHTGNTKEIKEFYQSFQDTVEALEKIDKNLNISFNQVAKLKERLLKPQKIESNLSEYIKEEQTLNQNSLAGMNKDELVKTLTAQYEKMIKDHIFVISEEVQKAERITSKTYDEISRLKMKTRTSLEGEIKDARIYTISILIIAIALSFILIFYIAKTISEPLKEIEKVIKKTTVGELPEYKAREEDSEIGRISMSVEELIASLKETSKFAEELAKGNFDTDFTPISYKDEFRNLLLELRDSLKLAKTEEEKRKIEDYQRRRVSEGLAKFAEILRGHHVNLKKLAEEIIVNLVRYLNANQGVIFILNDRDPENKYLELYAAYAWNRKKYLEKKIALGEGLIGAAAVEQFTIYMTDVPEDYIEIKSGTGEADPRAILIVPLKVENETLGVLELATFKEFEPYEIEMVEKIAENIASTLQNIKINEKTEELLRRFQEQAETMKKQENIMKRNIEQLRKAQEDNKKQEEELKKTLDQLEKTNQILKLKDKEKEKEIEKLKQEYEKQLKKRADINELIYKIFDNASSGVMVLNEEGETSYMNEALRGIIGEESEEGETDIKDLINKPADSKDKDIFEFLKKNIKSLGKDKRVFKLKTATGEEKNVMLEMMEFEDQDEKKLYVLMVKEQSLIEHSRLQKELEKALAREFEYIIKIEILIDTLKENNIPVPDIDVSERLVKWQDKFMMGIDSIDKQHKKWFEFINDLYIDMKAGSADEKLTETFNKLLDFTKYHFSFEEKYMKEFGFENIEDHKQKHEEFIANLYKLYNSFLNNDPTLGFKLLVYLKKWVVEHVLVEDRRYRDLFKKNGLK